MMSKEELDILLSLKSNKTNSAAELINGIHDRSSGHWRNIKSKENVELFAEEQLVRKHYLDEMRCEMPGQPRSTFLMVFSPDGQRVASTHGNHNIYVTDIKTGKNIKTLVGHPRTPWCIAFHPTSNQIVASGCLGGQVRIWDLSGGSEVWSTSTQSVIASIAFHPNDRVLVIATVNEVYFWDWSEPEPFVHVATSNPKEKVRYVAFDSLGHKLITGIANSPQTRWERVRAPVPVPRQERCASPYRRRITQRLVHNFNHPPPAHSSTPLHDSRSPRESLSAVPERERRITVSYRNLVREYEQLVHRYLQLYRPPTMIDRGTDPMEQSTLSNSGTQVPEPLTSGRPRSPMPSTSGTAGTSHSTQETSASDQLNSPAAPSTSDTTSQTTTSTSTATTSTVTTSTVTLSTTTTRTVPLSKNRYRITYSRASSSSTSTTNPRPVPGCSTACFLSSPGSSSGNLHSLVTPSRIFCVRKRPNMLIRGTQTSESRKHKSDGETPSTSQEKRFKMTDGAGNSSSSSSSSSGSGNGDTHDDVATDDRTESERTVAETEQEPDVSANRSSERVLVVSLQRLEPENIEAATNNDNELESGERIRDSSNLQPENSSTFTATRRSLEENYLWASDRVQMGLNAYIRANEQKLEEIHRRRRLRTLGGSTEPPSLNTRSNSTVEDDSLNQSSGLNLSSNSNDAAAESSTANDNLRPSSSGTSRSVSESLLSNIRRTAEEEVRNRILPIIRSIPANDRPELIRLFENNREHVRMRFRQMCPTFQKKLTRRSPVVDTSTDSSSSDNEQSTSSGFRVARRNSERDSQPDAEECATAAASTSPSSSNPNVSTTAPIGENSPSTSNGNSSRVRNFNTELEELVTSLLTEMEKTERLQQQLEQQYSNGNEGTSGLDNSNATLRNRSSSARTRTFSLRSSPPTTNRSTVEDDTEGASNPSTDNRNNSETGESYNGRRRVFSHFSHRLSAFMPTRVNYTRTSPTRVRRPSYGHTGRGRSGTAIREGSGHALDDLISYFDRTDNNEGLDDTPDPEWDTLPFDPPPDLPPINPDNIGIGNMYSNIVQDLESTLNDVRNIRASNRPGATANILSSFSERLENIMNQSEPILRNLRTSMEMLPAPSDRTARADDGFYVRNLRSDARDPPSERRRDENVSLQELFSPFNAIASDHTYPRNPTQSARDDQISPLVMSLHLTIRYIQRQARLLRHQVENIERIDRAMVEVDQLLLIRQMLIEIIRHERSGENRNTGMSSVRQMMAGTRISDSSPYDSPLEDQNSESSSQRPSSSYESSMDDHNIEGSSSQPINLSANRHRPHAGGSLSRAGQSSGYPSSSGGGTAAGLARRNSRRKTHTPARFLRTSQRRTSMLHWFSRRHSMGRFDRPGSSIPQRAPTTRLAQDFSILNSNTLQLMVGRLQDRLTDQMRAITRAQICRDPPPASRSSTPIDLGEHILALRLHGCLLRMNRVLGNNSESSALRNLSSDTAPVTPDGGCRHGARQTLSLIVDGLSRHLEDLGHVHIRQSTQTQLHRVLVMSVLLTELLLLQVINSIPSPTDMDLDSELVNFTNRIDYMCTQILHGRFGENSLTLTRHLELIRYAVRDTYRSLSRNTSSNIAPSRDIPERRPLVVSVGRPRPPRPRRPVQTESSQAATENETNQSEGEGRGPGDGSSTAQESTDRIPRNDWVSTFEMIARLSNRNRVATARGDSSGPSTSRSREEPPQQRSEPVGREGSNTVGENNSDPENDEDDGGGVWFTPPMAMHSSGGPHIRLVHHEHANDASSSGGNNSNAGGSGDHRGPWRPWNIPVVQLNDGPMSSSTTENAGGSSAVPGSYDPPFFAHRLSRQHRFVERISELRSNATAAAGLFRPRFLHPFYASVNPFDADLDDPQREQIYDSDMITTVTPNHRIQVWDISDWNVPIISNSLKNVVVNECKIHNDASVDIAKDGTILVTLLPSGGYLNVTNRLGVYSLRWETLGQCLYTTSFELNAVSVSLSPLSRHLVVGLASRRVPITPVDRWVMARIFKIEKKDLPGVRLPILRELEQSRENRINCIRWLPVSGQGLIYATNTGQLVVLS